jgi:hypothetical protein
LADADLSRGLAGGVVPRLLLTGPVRVTALVVQFVLHLALLFGRLSGVLGLRIRVGVSVLVHARSSCRLVTCF